MLRDLGIVDEVWRIVQTAQDAGVTLRALGAVAFRIHCRERLDIHSSLGRDISDIDLAGYKKHASQICKIMDELGYELDRRMLLHEDRYFFSHRQTRVKADVFLDKLEMCHTIHFLGRLEQDYPTVPLEELLLEKLQIVNIERKDIVDLAMLLSTHDLGTGKESIDDRYVARLAADDWGLYFTIMANLTKVTDFIRQTGTLESSDKDRVLKNLESLHTKIEMHPKSFAWKMRAKVGPKVKWYRDVSTPSKAY